MHWASLRCAISRIQQYQRSYAKRGRERCCRHYTSRSQTTTATPASLGRTTRPKSGVEQTHRPPRFRANPSRGRTTPRSRREPEIIASARPRRRAAWAPVKPPRQTSASISCIKLMHLEPWSQRCPTSPRQGRLSPSRTHQQGHKTTHPSRHHGLGCPEIHADELAHAPLGHGHAKKPIHPCHRDCMMGDD